MLTIYTARLPRPEKGKRGYKGDDALDVTRGTADAAHERGEVAFGEPFAPSRELLDWGLAACREGRREQIWAEYAERYRGEMRMSLRREREAWASLLERESVTLVCFCDTAERCHRTVLADLLASFARHVRVDARLGGERVVAMRVLTLWEPWATFMALEGKGIESRSWATPYRGPIAIQAAKITSEIDGAADAWEEAGFDPATLPGDGAWPLGSIISVGELVDCFRVKRILSPTGADGLPLENGLPVDVEDDQGTRRAVRWADWRLGDLRPGRVGWLTRGMRRLRAPVPVRGHQGLWELDETTERAVLAQLEPAAAAAGGARA